MDIIIIRGGKTSNCVTSNVVTGTVTDVDGYRILCNTGVSPALQNMTSASCFVHVQLLRKMAATAMEAKKFEYFSSINSMARKIMQEREKIKDGYGSAWDDMTPLEQDSAFDDGMMEPKIRARYAMHREERTEVQCYPKLLIQTGQKIVHFGDEVGL